MKEQRDDPLPQLLQQALREIPIAIVTSAARAGGAENVQNVLEGYGLDVRVHSSLGEGQLPSLEKVMRETGLKNATGFIDFCGTLGEKLIGDGRDAPGRALGYGNDGMLIVSSSNTPTMTLTALWKEGNESVPWRPLVPRKPKK